MLNPQALQLRVGVDVGSRCHSVAVGLTDGSLLEEFEIPHTAAGFRDFFARIEGHAKRHPYPIAIAMEGYNGHVRPLDSLVKARGWRLFNVNNLKLARFKEIFPAAAKSDRIDSAKTLELFQLRDHLPMAGDVLQEVMATPEENDTLKRLSRRRRRLVNERGRVINSLQADLQAVAPGLLQITRDVGNLWFLNFLTCRKGLLKLARVGHTGLLKVPGIGATYADAIQAWQSRAFFGHDASLVGDMIQQDAARNPRVETADQGFGRGRRRASPRVPPSPASSPPSRAMARFAPPSWPVKSAPSSASGARPAWPSISAWPRSITVPASSAAQRRQSMSTPVPRRR